MANTFSFVLSTARRRISSIKLLLPESRHKVTDDAASFWSASTDNSRIKDLSHWLGEGRWSDEKSWLAIGEKHFGMYEKLCLLADRPRPLQSMVEWGPGGGANAVRFCSEISQLHGVDVSEANLKKCEQQLERRGFNGFHPVLIDIHHPEEALTAVGSPVEFFIATAVYQHFPGKLYGVKITKLAYELLNDNGIALIQIRYSDGSKALRPKRNHYAKNAITFTSYNIAEFWDICFQAGFEPLAISLELSPKYAYFYLKKR